MQILEAERMPRPLTQAQAMWMQKNKVVMDESMEGQVFLRCGDRSAIYEFAGWICHKKTPPGKDATFYRYKDVKSVMQFLTKRIAANG